MKRQRYRFPGGLKTLLFICALSIGLFLHLYTQRVIHQLRDEARSLVSFYARLHARVADTDADFDLSFIFEQIIMPTHFPLINTDSHNEPQWWEGISVDPDDRSPESVERVRDLVKQMGRENDPVPIKVGENLLGYLYYGDSRLIQQLRWLPYVEIGVIGLFILLGLVGYAHIKKSEQRHIWVGMAKETAHQLGTPISSLMGWLEVMRSGKTRDRSFIYKEMERDLHRLQRVSTRFSQIGSRPDLKDSDITGILKEVVEYIQRRAPQTGRKVSIREDYQPVPPVALNRDLFQWAAENILKNSLDAMDKEEGRIVVALKTEKEGRCVSIQFRDNGRGMDKEQRRHLFRPGYSTKRRGWGLGLTLARRIIRDYHGGKLQVQESRPGEGTVMRIELYC